MFFKPSQIWNIIGLVNTFILIPIMYYSEDFWYKIEKEIDFSHSMETLD